MRTLRRVPFVAVGWSVLWAINVYGVGLNVGHGSYGWAVFSLLAALCASFLCIVSWKEWRKRGRDRKAEEDRGDTGPDTGLTFNLTYSGGSTISIPGCACPSCAGSSSYTAKRTREGARLAVEQADEPIRGWRAAQVVLEGNRYRFQSVIAGHGSYDAEAVAACHRNDGYYGIRISMYHSEAERRHEAPGEDCSCGFYAVIDPADVEDLAHGRGTVMIEADLYGRVIVHERGYRAQKQRALSVTIPADCLYCTNAAQPAVPVEGGPLVFVCEKHLPEDHVLISSHDLAAKLGTEVRRAEAR